MFEGLASRARKPERRAKYDVVLACPPAPPELSYLRRIYDRLRRRKGGTGFGPAPVEWPDIDAFLRHSGLRLEPWEVEVIEDLDDAFMAAPSNAKTLEDDA